ncbi:hypothetical protein [Ensifer sp. B1-9]|uniref:hypothetical protein n=1 Tax=Ensifer sp. B1-9 TaxID=3141455 RepID=UPI003D1EA52D
MPYDIGTILFHDQIAIKSIDALPFSEQGDSGALILEQTTGMAIGLLFAGTSTISFANHIADVLDSFGLEIDRELQRRLQHIAPDRGSETRSAERTADDHSGESSIDW